MEHLPSPGQPRRASRGSMAPKTRSLSTPLILPTVNTSKKEKRARRTPRTGQKRWQAAPHTYAGRRPNPRASNQLRRLRKSRPSPLWFCCRFPRRLPWSCRQLPVCFSPPPRPRSSAVRPREQRRTALPATPSHADLPGACARYASLPLCDAVRPGSRTRLTAAFRWWESERDESLGGASEAGGFSWKREGRCLVGPGSEAGGAATAEAGSREGMVPGGAEKEAQSAPQG